MRRQVVNAEDFLRIELFSSGEIVVARLELEIEEIRFGDESRLVDGTQSEVRRLAFLRPLGLALGAVLPPLVLAVDPTLLVRPAVGL